MEHHHPAFHTRCLQRVLGVTWLDIMPNEEIFQRTVKHHSLTRWDKSGLLGLAMLPVCSAPACPTTCFTGSLWDARDTAQDQSVFPSFNSEFKTQKHSPMLFGQAHFQFFLSFKFVDCNAVISKLIFIRLVCSYAHA